MELRREVPRSGRFEESNNGRPGPLQRGRHDSAVRASSRHQGTSSTLPVFPLVRLLSIMNVFVLCTGRCGSTTFVKACSHATNYSSAHESRANVVGPERLAYPPNHIEADNRLSWFLGRLERTYGNNAFYVHLTRSREETARSFTKRWDHGIMQAYRVGVLMKLPAKSDR